MCEPILYSAAFFAFREARTFSIPVEKFNEYFFSEESVYKQGRIGGHVGRSGSVDDSKR